MVKPIMSQLYNSLFITLLLLSISVVQAATTAKLSRYHISVNESVDLVITSDQSENLDAEVTQALSKDFDIRNQGKSTETSCINMSCNTSHKTTFMLMPKRPGVFMIPAITIDGETTDPLKLTVSDVNQDPNQGAVDPVFAQLSIDKTQVKVQEQAILKLTINSSINISNLQLEPFDIPNATLKELTNTNYQQTIGGVPYTTYEVSYAIFPLKSEAMTIGPIRVIGLASDGRQQGFSSFFNRGKQISFRSNSITLDVEPAPSGFTGSWLPAQSLTLSENWLSDLNNVKVGDSITREIQVSALGLSAEQLPNIHMQGDSQFKAYQEQSKLDNLQNEKGIIGKLTENIAIVPSKAGDLTLPAIKINWWDVNTRRLRTAEIPAKTIHVKENPEHNHQPTGIAQPIKTTEAPLSQPPTPSITEPDEATNNSLWVAIACLSILLNIVLLVLYLKGKRSQQEPSIKTENPEVDDKAPYDLIRAGCESGNPKAIKSALLLWAKHVWPNKQVYSLTDIARVIDTEAFDKMVKDIDAAQYNHESMTLDASALINELEKHYKPKSKDELEKLYPTQ